MRSAGLLLSLVWEAPLVLLGRCATTTLWMADALSVTAATAPPTQDRGKVVIVTGATGSVGSRLVKQLLLSEDDRIRKGQAEGTNVKVVAVVRNATKARSIFGMKDDGTKDIGSAPTSPNHVLEILEADFEDQKSLESAFHRAIYDNRTSVTDGGNLHASLFLACGNVPNQLAVELNIARAASAVGSSVAKRTDEASKGAGGGGIFCVKLSTAEPLVRSATAGHGASHRAIEEELPALFPGDRYAILRPSVFLQMLDPAKGGTLLGIDVDRDGGSVENLRHLLAANQGMCMIDCEDVAACARAILLSAAADATREHRGRRYELTGPRPKDASWTREFCEAVSSLRPIPLPTIEEFSSLERGLEAAGIPPPAFDRLRPFLASLLSYEKASDHVHRILGRPPRSVSDFVFDDPRPFLPRRFSQLRASGRATSFRAAARVDPSRPLGEELGRLASDELLIRVRVAGVNGGADTFSVAKARAESRDFPLGSEGTGVVVATGDGSGGDGLRTGDRVIFIGKGAYGEYVRAKDRMCHKVPEYLRSRKCDNLPGDLTALRISGLTALVALERTCPVQKGDVVLVTACCGGTGHFAVQIAKNAGATVVGTVGSTAKVKVANNLGCIDRVVDLSVESLDEVLRNEFPQGIDICYEGVGGKVLKAAHNNLAAGGRILVVGSISQYPHNPEKDAHGIDEVPDDVMKDVFGVGATLDLERDCKLIGNVWGDAFVKGDLERYRDRIYELYGQGKIRALLDPEHTFSGVDSVCNAVDHMLSRKSVGKVTVTISSH